MLPSFAVGPAADILTTDGRVTAGACARAAGPNGLGTDLPTVKRCRLLLELDFALRVSSYAFKIQRRPVAPPAQNGQLLR